MRSNSQSPVTPMKKSLLLILAILITGIVLFYAWTDWQGARQLKAALAMLEQKHESIRLEDFIPPAIPDERNVAAAPIFKEYFNPLWRHKKNDSRLEKLKEPWQTTPHSEIPGNLLLVARQIDSSFNGDELGAWKIIHSALNHSAPLLTELREALARPEIAWPLDYSAAPYMFGLPQITIQMRIARIFRARALAEIATGDFSKAFEDTQTLLALARISKEPHLVICELVETKILNMACDVINEALNHAAWNDAQLAAISTELAQPQLLRQYAEALRMGRTFSFQWDLSNPQVVHSIDFDLREVITKSMEKKNLNYFFLKILHSNKNLHLAIYRLSPSGWGSEEKTRFAVTIQQMIDALGNGEKLSSPEVWNNIKGRGNISAWELIRKPLYSLEIQAAAENVKIVCQGQTTLSSLRAACAIERYRLANHRLPLSLDELVPALLPSVPKDPMTGNPLLYKTSPDGSFVIYGLGWNRKDEGGPKVSSFNKQPEDQANWGIVVSTPK